MPTALTDRAVGWLLHLAIFELVGRAWLSSGPTYPETGSSSFGLRTMSEVRFHDPNDNPLPARIPKNSAPRSTWAGKPPTWAGKAPTRPAGRACRGCRAGQKKIMR